MGRGSGPSFRLTSSDRLELQRLVRTGERYVDAASVVGCSAQICAATAYQDRWSEAADHATVGATVVGRGAGGDLPWTNIRHVLPSDCYAAKQSCIDRFA